ncbi:MAG TPA: inorganic phosphate transporter, partial [Bacteroidales bacterium]|nr:inorganic phosphate transporter [Bacteroidales bacterium]
SVFVILGAVAQGAGASQTLGKLGAVNAVGGSFTVALAAAITVYVLTKFALPASATQAIVGAIIGWNFFTGNATDSKALEQIVTTWVTGPVLGAVFAILLYIILKKIKVSSHIHLIRFESYIKTGLILVGAFGAYSLGANNIANVMGVFVPAFSLHDLHLWGITLSSGQQLFMLGGLAIATGIITYSRKVMETVGENIVELSSEAALVVVLAQALVLFIFSSSSLSHFFVSLGFPPIPMVPVSSSQVIVGCVLGIGLYNGAGNINFRILGEIGIGWIATPVSSGLLSFFSLFFMKNIFGVDVGTKIVAGMDDTASKIQSITNGAQVSGIVKYLLTGLIISGTITLIIYILLDRKKQLSLQKSEEKFWKNLK